MRARCRAEESMSHLSTAQPALRLTASVSILNTST
jgi:hypothetical protein